MGTLVRELFGPHVVDDREAPPNYSVDHLGATAGPATAMKVVYRDTTPVVRTRSTARLLEGLVRHVAGEHTTRDDLLELRVLAVTAEGSAVFLPAPLRTRLARLGPHLRQEGLRALDEPVARIDPATGELVVTEPELAVDWQVLADLAPRGLDDGRAGHDPPVATGRYRSRRLHVRASDGIPRTRAQALATVAVLARNAALLPGQALLEALSAFVRACPVQPLPQSDDDAGLAAAVRSAVER